MWLPEDVRELDITPKILGLEEGLAPFHWNRVVSSGGEREVSFVSGPVRIRGHVSHGRLPRELAVVIAFTKAGVRPTLWTINPTVVLVR